MKKINFDRAVPPVPDEFVRAMSQAIERAKAADAPRARIKRATWIVAAILAVLLVGTAFALTRGLGIMDFLNDYKGGPEVLPEASDMVSHLDDAPEARTSRMAYRATEAMMAGGRVMVTIEARLLEPAKYLLMGEGGWANLDLAPEGAQSPATWRELSAQSGKRLLDVEFYGVWVNGARPGAWGPMYKAQGDALYAYLDMDLKESAGGISFGEEGGAPIALPDGKEPVELRLEMMDYGLGDAKEDDPIERVTLNLTLDPADTALNTVALSEPVHARAMTVDALTFVRTPFDCQITATYTVAADAAERLDADSVYASFFWMADAQGDQTHAGDDASAQTEWIEETARGKTYRSTRRWETIDEPPQVVFIRPYYWDTEAWGDLIELHAEEEK